MMEMVGTVSWKNVRLGAKERKTEYENVCALNETRCLIRILSS
jgi:hypothetical protein